MPRRPLKISEAGKSLHRLPHNQSTDTQTAWMNLWAVASRLRRAQDQAAGRKVTEKINADPAEVERLRSARKNARAGRTLPRHSDTS